MKLNINLGGGNTLSLLQKLIKKMSKLFAGAVKLDGDYLMRKSLGYTSGGKSYVVLSRGYDGGSVQESSIFYGNIHLFRGGPSAYLINQIYDCMASSAHYSDTISCKLVHSGSVGSIPTCKPCKIKYNGHNYMALELSDTLNASVSVLGYWGGGYPITPFLVSTCEVIEYK